MNRMIAALWLLTMLLLTSCASGYQITGSSSISGLDGKRLYLRTMQGDEWVSVDSAEMVHGHFSMNGEVDTTLMVTLFMGEESVMPMVLEQGDIKVTIAPSELKAAGTPLNDRLYGFITRRNELESKVMELNSREAQEIMAGADADEVGARIGKENEALVKEMHDYAKQFIKENFDNVLGPTVFMMMCNTLPYPVMTPEIEDLMRTAPISFRQDSMVRTFLDAAKENMKLIEEHQRMQENATVKAAEAGRR